MPDVFDTPDCIWPVEHRSFGRREDLASVVEVNKRLKAAFGASTFQTAAPHLVGAGDGKTVLLHQAAKVVLGGFLQSQFQPRGTCVSRGAKRTVDLLQCVAIAEGNLKEFKYASHAYIYGTCREHGGDLHNNQDGAVGAWAAWAVANDGVVTNADVGDDDNKDDLAVKWGNVGVPGEVKQLGRKHLVTAVVAATSTADVRDAIASMKGVTVASNQGFEPFKRDSDGLCRPGGTWPHQMCVTGYRADKQWFLIDQSWGPDQPGGPTGDIEIPPYSFWITESVMARMVGQHDTFIYAGIDGWDAPKMHWYA